MRDTNLLINNGIKVKEALNLFGTIDKYDNVLEVFYNTIDGKLTELKSYKDLSELKQYAILVHALKSEAGYFGCEMFHELAYKHEIAAKKNDVTFINDHFDELINEIKRVITIVGQYLGKEEVGEIVGNTTVSNMAKEILVIDDSETVSHMIYQVFGKRFEVLLATNSIQANHMLTDNTIGVIINFQMQEITSIWNVLKINPFIKKNPICIISDKNLDVSAHNNVELLRRPFNERDIKAQVEKFLIFHQ